MCIYRQISRTKFAVPPEKVIVSICCVFKAVSETLKVQLLRIQDGEFLNQKITQIPFRHFEHVLAFSGWHTLETCAGILKCLCERL